MLTSTLIKIQTVLSWHMKLFHYTTTGLSISANLRTQQMMQTLAAVSKIEHSKHHCIKSPLIYYANKESNHYLIMKTELLQQTRGYKTTMYSTTKPYNSWTEYHHNSTPVSNISSKIHHVPCLNRFCKKNQLHSLTTIRFMTWSSTFISSSSNDG